MELLVIGFGAGCSLTVLLVKLVEWIGGGC